MAIFGTASIGDLIGFLLGGWINEWFGWSGFFVVGVRAFARTGVPIDGRSLQEAT